MDEPDERPTLAEWLGGMNDQFGTPVEITVYDGVTPIPTSDVQRVQDYLLAKYQLG